MENNDDNSLRDNQEDIHHEDNHEDLSNKDIKIISKVIHCSKTLTKVTKGKINSEDILEDSQTFEDIKIDLEILWTHATMP
jgi:hypothetical protein